MPSQWAARGEELGAGEILLTSMDTDGVLTGFDCALTRAVSRATQIPVIASGGAGEPEHFVARAHRRRSRRRPRRLHISLRHIHRERHQRVSRPRRHPGQENSLIIPCIDLMGGKVVQLVQGREKALEGDSPERNAATLRRLPADSGHRSRCRHRHAAPTTIWSKQVAGAKPSCRVGGGVRTVERARDAPRAGRVPNHRRHFGLQRRGPEPRVSRSRSPKPSAATASSSRSIQKAARIVIKGWRESTNFTAEEVVQQLEPYCSGFLCTYVDKEGMMQGTDLDWFRRLRDATDLEITAAGGITTLDDIRALDRHGIHSAVGMAIYTGRLDLAELAAMSRGVT